VTDSTGDQEPADETRRVTIRLPAALHEALLTHRNRVGKSLNDILIDAIAKLVGVRAPQLKKGIPGPKPKKRKA
jgi:hypothetical protein